MQVLRENNSNVVNIKKITHQFDKISNRIIFERDRLSLLKQDDFFIAILSIAHICEWFANIKVLGRFVLRYLTTLLHSVSFIAV